MKKNKRCVYWGLSVLASMMYGGFAYAQTMSFQDAEGFVAQTYL